MLAIALSVVADAKKVCGKIREKQQPEQQQQQQQICFRLKKRIFPHATSVILCHIELLLLKRRFE